LGRRDAAGEFELEFRKAVLVAESPAMQTKPARENASFALGALLKHAWPSHGCQAAVCSAGGSFAIDQRHGGWRRGSRLFVSVTPTLTERHNVAGGEAGASRR